MGITPSAYDGMNQRLHEGEDINAVPMENNADSRKKKRREKQ